MCAHSPECSIHVYIALVLPATSVYHITSFQFITVARTIQSFYLFSHIARPSLDSRLTARHIPTYDVINVHGSGLPAMITRKLAIGSIVIDASLDLEKGFPWPEIFSFIAKTKYYVDGLCLKEWKQQSNKVEKSKR